MLGEGRRFVNFVRYADVDRRLNMSLLDCSDGHDAATAASAKEKQNAGAAVLRAGTTTTSATAAVVEPVLASDRLLRTTAASTATCAAQSRPSGGASLLVDAAHVCVGRRLRLHGLQDPAAEPRALRGRSGRGGRGRARARGGGLQRRRQCRLSRLRGGKVQCGVEQGERRNHEVALK